MKFTVNLGSQTKYVDASRFYMNDGFVIFFRDAPTPVNHINSLWVNGQSSTVAAYPLDEVKSVESEGVSLKEADDDA